MRRPIHGWPLSATGVVVSCPVTKDSKLGVHADDAALAAEVANGDEEALGAAFAAYGGAVNSMALRVLRDETLAEDITQDVFVAFWNDPHKFDASRGSLRTFLITLAHRRAVDMVRSEVARAKREEKTRERDIASDLEEEVWTRTVGESVHRALETLSVTERDAITLAYFGGLSYVEVAKRLGAPEGTVKSRIRVGMRKLSTALSEVVTP